MKYSVTLLALWVALAGFGCNTLTHNQAQYHVVGPANDRGVRAAVSTSDKAGVKELLSAVAAQWKLVDRTSTSFMPTVIASYSQDWNQYPLTLTAFEQNGAIIVDMTQPSDTVGESRLWRARQDKLLELLREKYGNRAVVPKLSDWVRHVQQPVQ